MKKLLSVAVLLALATALVPVHAFAAQRGVWDPITAGPPFQDGLSNGCEQASLRPGLTTVQASFANGGGTVAKINGHAKVELWFAFTTRSIEVGREFVRSIWQCQNVNQIGFLVDNILDARRPLLRDTLSVISYIDPAWSPNGKYLAYVQTDGDLTQTDIYIQEFKLSTESGTAATKVGSPILVVPGALGVQNRNPDWKPDGTAICYSSDIAGPSLDIWYVNVTPATATVGVPARATTVDDKAEITPTWGPGNRIAYSTNKFGRNVIEIVDLDDPTVPTGSNLTLAETNFANISHNNPSFSADGNSIYYDAPQDEDVNTPTDIWKLDIPTQSKCDIYFDAFGDSDPDASALTNTTLEGIEYNLFECTTTAAQGTFGGLNIWRGSAVVCSPALPVLVAVSPTSLNLGSSGKNITVTISFPPETQAAGYRAAVDVPEHGGGIPVGFEGIKNRLSIIPSPTFLGRRANTSDATGQGAWSNVTQGGELQVEGLFARKSIEARLVALGLVNQIVPCTVRGYSNVRGRQYQGFGYIRIVANNLAGQAVRMEQNAPNPFNPVTKIHFAVAKPGFVNVRIYNVRGELVKTIASGNYGTGSHEATWDGTTRFGGKASTGVYFAKASVGNGPGSEVTSDVIKMVMAK